ncbi:hypothetical protein E5288_WYG010543 [Bos mutus]|uniref:Uncharacterized protein n=1 Tax=Bos mutus TaxID=72004 RepID=A0A6B0RKP3_9CETA|nr:hypothetical protein [Bos mutus]
MTPVRMGVHSQYLHLFFWFIHGICSPKHILSRIASDSIKVTNRMDENLDLNNMKISLDVQPKYLKQQCLVM